MGTANATVTANFTATGADNTITPIDDKEVGVLKSITLTPTSNNGTTPFSFSTTSDKISLSTTSGTSCEITGLSVTGETDAVVVIGQATGTHNATYYKAATPIYVNISVVDNRTTPDIIFSEDEIDLTAGDDQTITVTTDHTGTRSVTSSDDEIASVELSSGNVYVLAGDKGGTATITLSITENGDYKSTSKSFTVNVNDGKSDPTITVDKTEVGINTSDTFTLTSNSEGAITITMDAEYEEYAELKDNSDGTFKLSGLAEGTITINVSQAENGSYRAYETTFNISVVDNRTTPTFSFSDASKIIEWADRNSYVKPTLTNTSDGTVTYTSSNTGVATVGSNGDITFVAGGETIITASVSGSANYKDAEASYTLTVNKPFEFADDFTGASISSGALSTTAHSSGWTVSTAYTDNSNGVDASTCIRLASGNYGGSITTPALTDLPDNSKMTFQAKSYGSDTNVSLSISGTNCTVEPTSFNITNSYATYTVYITKTGNNPKITISAPTKSKRAYIDNFSITDLPNATISISDIEVKAGATTNATITTNNETGAFTFVSSDENVATVAKVDNDYVVTGIAEGTATITATQAGNTYYKTTSTTFTVNVISATAVMNPTLSVASDTEIKVEDVITIEAEEGCTIKYTIDNTDPKESSTATSVNTNTANVTVPTGINSLTLKVVAKKDENFSDVVTATYTVVKKTLNASFTPNAIEVAIGTDANEPTLYNPSEGTVTWESSNTEVVTVNSEGQLTAIAEGTATITASIAETDTYLAGSATYEVTVYDLAKIVVDFNNDPFEIGNGKYDQDVSLSYTYKGVIFDFAKGEGNTSPRVDGNVSDKVARIYLNNTLNVTAPTGYAISKIVFDFNKGSINIGGDTYSSDVTTWKGIQTPVQIIGLATTFINKMTITLVETESVTVSDAGYATYASDNDLDFTDSNIKAYIAKAKNDGSGVTFERKYKIPAGTGVLLYKDGGATEAIPVFDPEKEDADETDGNKFVRGTGGTVATDDGINYNYILNNGVNGIGFYRANNKKVAVNRAYICIPKDEIAAADAKDFFSMPGFDDDPTGINDLADKTGNERNEIYNLAGQRINKLQKGINIINGKKIMK